MKLTRNTVNTFGYISVAMMLAMLLLIWLKLVPDSFMIPFFVIALVLVAARTVMRILLARLERGELKSGKPRPSHD